LVLKAYIFSIRNTTFFIGNVFGLILQLMAETPPLFRKSFVKKVPPVIVREAKRMFSQRNNPYCEFLQIVIAKVQKYFD